MDDREQVEHGRRERAERARYTSFVLSWAFIVGAIAVIRGVGVTADAIVEVADTGGTWQALLALFHLWWLAVMVVFTYRAWKVRR
jgi:hypothetical protein